MNFFNDFLNYEKENKLYEKEILDFKYWEYVRFVVYTEVKIQVYHLSELLAVPKIGIKNYIFSLKNLNKYIGFSKLENKELLFISHPRRINQDNKYENIYTDEVVNYLSNRYKCLTIEEPCWNSFVSSDRGHLFPVATNDIKFTDFYEINYLIKKRFFKYFNNSKYSLIDREATSILKNLNDKYNVDIMYVKPRVVNAILYGILMKKKYERVIKKIAPKAVIINYWPTDFKTMIMDICNSCEIPTIELQHGTITYDDPIEHKCYDNSLCHCTSKYFLSFGKVHTDDSYLTTKKENLRDVGYPFLEKKMSENYSLPEELEKNEKYILIISQTIIGEEMSNFASNLAKLLKNKPEYKIIFKFHPNEIDRDYPNLEKDNIIQIKQKGSEIYKYQKYSCLQVGVYSTAIYEGLAFKIPTFILKGQSGSEESEKLLSYMKKGIYFINNENELYNYLDKELEQPLVTDLEKLWKFNSLKNVETEIENIIKEYGD